MSLRRSTAGREDPLANRRRSDAIKADRRPLDDARRRVVGRPSRLHRARRRRDGRLDPPQSGRRYGGRPGFLAVDEIRFSARPRPHVAAQRPRRPAGDRRLAVWPYRRRTARLEAAIPPPTLAWPSPTGPARTSRSTSAAAPDAGRRRPAPLPRSDRGHDQPTRPTGSGRLELARRMVDPANPLIARVIVNRVWHHLFGRGIVADGRRLRRAGRAADASRTARLPGRPGSSPTAGRSSDCIRADRAVAHLPDVAAGPDAEPPSGSIPTTCCCTG